MHICNITEDHTLVISTSYTLMITKNQSLTIALRLRNLRICVKYAKCDENNVFYSLPVVTKIQEKNRNKSYCNSKKGLDTVSTIDFWVIRLQHRLQHMKKWTLLLKCIKEDVQLLVNLRYLWYLDFSVWNSNTILGQRISALVISFESAWQHSQLEFQVHSFTKKRHACNIH